MAVFSSDKARKSSPAPTPISGIQHVDCMKILGIIFEHRLTVHEHIDNVCLTTFQVSMQ